MIAAPHQFSSAKRVNRDQPALKRILNRARCDTFQDIDGDDKGLLMPLHLNHKKYTDQDRKQIQGKPLFVFANKGPRDGHNYTRLKAINSPNNPVARVASTTENYKGDGGYNPHFDSDRAPTVTNICKGAKVSLNGVNYKPSWGLYHGSIGAVVDVISRGGQNPNLGGHPLYTLVDSPQYCGPAFIPEHPTCVPIPMHNTRCEYACCNRTYLPLSLAFGKTAHTIQGQTIGPVPPERPPNPVESIVVDPGTRRFEGTCIGLFYTLLGRGTTIGKQDDNLSSSIYFAGPDMSKHRISMLWSDGVGNPYKEVVLRSQWVEYLNKHKRESSGLTAGAKQKLFQWAKQTRFTAADLTTMWVNIRETNPTLKKCGEITTVTNNR